ncbi:MAG: hypothetical protein KDC87_19975 [Planctomycetes bacterium]|nr:hypothetical protein [Planctomycetota bacterium]MCB9869686.1 hypothetical protein [Planctomycetota bacterium]
MIRTLLSGFTATLALALPTSAQCVWGSFDSTRINYSGGELTGSAHSTLRGLIATNGGVVGNATATLTSTYLAGVSVFYTSLLRSSGGAGTLTAPEQTALQNWVNAGGVLVVTGDNSPLPAYDSFTSWLGYTWATTGRTGVGKPTAAVHAITAGIVDYYAALGATFSNPPGSTLLGVDAGSSNFLALMPPSSTRLGWVLVIGDHNIFTDSYIGRNDNQKLANNITRWACSLGGCNTPASWSNYCSGLAGSAGIPTLISSANPVNDSTIVITGSNSSGNATNCLVAVGLSAISVPFLGGTLCTSVDIGIYTTISSAGLALPVKIPPASVFCGTPVHLQLLQLDSAAANGVSFTPGLRLIPGK